MRRDAGLAPVDARAHHLSPSLRCPLSLHVSFTVTSSQEFFKKIKFKYLEQEAKETFLKLILAEDPVQIDREDNNRLELENAESKHTLKQAKHELDALRNQVSRVAEEVATGAHPSLAWPTYQLRAQEG